MAASSQPKQNFLAPKFPLAFLAQFGLALVEQVSAAVKAAGIDTSSSTTKKVVAAFRDASCDELVWTDVQYHPRAWNRKEIRPLWLCTDRKTCSPPKEIFRAEAENWTETTGKVSTRVACHPSVTHYVKSIRDITHQSEPFSAWIARNTRLIYLAEKLGKKAGHWTALPMFGGPLTLYCPSAIYTASNGKKRLIAVPVGQVFRSKDEGNWQSLLCEQICELHQVAAAEDADLEICCPREPHRYWPDFAERYI